MKKVNYIFLLIGLLLCAVLVFGCADPKAGVDDIPADDRVEEDAKGEEEKKEDKEEKQEETTGEDTADAEVTTDVLEETTAKPEDTTAKPADTTAKPADTTAKPVETTAKPVKVDPPTNVPNVEKPSDDLIKRIENDYSAYLLSQNDGYNPNLDGIYPIEAYYGEIAGWVPIMFRQPQTGAIRKVELAGYTFWYQGGNSIQVWKNGEFFYLDEAYEKGFLTTEHIAIIAVIHNKGLYYKITQ